MASLRFLGFVFLLLVTAANIARASENTFTYEYKNDEGRSVFTNELERIPLKYQSRVQVRGLGHVSLNTDVATDLKAALADERAALLRSDHCKKATADSQLSFWDAAFSDHPWLYLALPAFLLLAGPTIIRGLFTWKALRVACLVIPPVVAVSLFAHQMKRTLRKTKQAKEWAETCKGSEQISDKSGLAKSIEAMHRHRAQRRKLIAE